MNNHHQLVMPFNVFLSDLVLMTYMFLAVSRWASVYGCRVLITAKDWSWDR
jgi:hypothetical protein